jgi:hypothetical protein
MTAHTKISFVKSGFRIFGYSLLLLNTSAAVLFLIASELIGILEECVV